MFVNPTDGNLYEPVGEPVDGVQRYYVWVFWAGNPPVLYKQLPIRDDAFTWFELPAGSHESWEERDLEVTRAVRQPTGEAEILTYTPIRTYGLPVGAKN